MNDSPVDCQNVKLPQATFVTRAAARPTKTLSAKKVVLKQNGSTKALPYLWMLMNLVGEGLAPPAKNDYRETKNWRPDGRRQTAARLQAISSPLQDTFNFIVGAIHESPVFYSYHSLYSYIFNGNTIWAFLLPL